MKMKKWVCKLIAFIMSTALIVNYGYYSIVHAESSDQKVVVIKGRQMEKLDRGLIAIKTNQGIFLSWRMLGTDPEDISFNIYRDGVKINLLPISESTNYLDKEGNENSKYVIKAVNNGVEIDESKEVTVWNKNYITIPLQQPTASKPGVTYTPHDCSAGDLDGDGEYELVLKWEPTDMKDNSQKGITSSVYLDGLELDGTRLWRINLGPNIRAGAHYTQFMVYDFDGDGKAEVACKTADGTIDGKGNVIGDKNAYYVNSDGYILEGPEYLTIFNGQTGEAIDTVEYDPPRGNVSSWGDSYGNRVDRFLAAVAYLDGKKPSLIMCRGYYTKTYIVAWDFDGTKLIKRWRFDTGESKDGYRDEYEGQGNHNLSVGDVDNDGKDEIIYGSMAVDDNGEPLYSTKLGHGDAMHLGDFDPDRPGLEVWQCHEDTKLGAGADLHDAATGEILVRVTASKDTGRALAADIDPRYRGAELWASSGVGLRKVDGTVISTTYLPPINFAVWWDGDLLRELIESRFVYEEGEIFKEIVNEPYVYKWDFENLKTDILLSVKDECYGVLTKATPSLTADLFGDWREEIVWRGANNKELRIYTTTDLTKYKIPTLMHDPVYRLGIAWQNVAYNQPPHPSFYLGYYLETPTEVTILDNKKKVELRWKNVRDAVYYKIFRCVNDPIRGDSEYEQIAVVDNNTFVDTDVVPGFTYKYRIMAYNPDYTKLKQESYWSNPVSTIVIDPDVNMQLPTQLSIVSTDENSVTIKWKEVPNAQWYNVYRSENENGPYTKIGSTLSLTYTDEVPTYYHYYYRVSAVGRGGESELSEYVVSPIKKIPSPPQNVKCVRARSDSILIRWQPVEGAVYYGVYRMEVGKQIYEKIGQTNKTEFVDNGLSEGKRYFYGISAINAAGESQLSISDEIIPGKLTLKFDFGGSTTPVMFGYIGVSNNKAYNQLDGYGFMNTSAVGFRDRGAPDDLLRDFCFANDNTVPIRFNVDVPPGIYKVKVISGDYSADNTTGISVENNEIYTIKSAKGTFGSVELIINVEDNQLNFTFSNTARVNAIEIEEAQQIIKAIKPITIITKIGEKPNLPPYVEAIYEDNSTEKIKVVWEEISEDKYSKEGIFTVEGTVYGSSIKAITTIVVRAGAVVNLRSPQYISKNTEFDVYLEVYGEEPIVGQDLIIEYDSTVFEYIYVECLPNEWAITDMVYNEVYERVYEDGYEEHTIGLIKISVAPNGNQFSLDKGDLLRFTFRPKIAKKGWIKVTESCFKKNDGSLEYGREVYIEIVVDGNKQKLKEIIDNLVSLYNTAIEGIQVGEYHIGAKEKILKPVIDFGNSVLSNTYATDEEISNAMAVTMNAVVRFNNMLITENTGDINKIKGVDIGDIALIAIYYGIKEGDNKWALAKIADINDDGEVGIYDLAFVGKRLLLRTRE